MILLNEKNEQEAESKARCKRTLSKLKKIPISSRFPSEKLQIICCVTIFELLHFPQVPIYTYKVIYIPLSAELRSHFSQLSHNNPIKNLEKRFIVKFVLQSIKF